MTLSILPHLFRSINPESLGTPREERGAITEEEITKIISLRRQRVCMGQCPYLVNDGFDYYCERSDKPRNFEQLDGLCMTSDLKYRRCTLNATRPVLF